MGIRFSMNASGLLLRRLKSAYPVTNMKFMIIPKNMKSWNSRLLSPN
uniref:Uncharacterized protein n=1 Tax=Romanomermis culicivorax TaxID=13658 RepID=A0A915JIV7_ROMCU